MNYTEKQIENAKKAYNEFLKIRTVESYEPQYIGYSAAEQRSEYHNGIVNKINSGDKALEREWKMFFLKQEVEKDLKIESSKNKLKANKEASSDVLAKVKQAGKKLGDYYVWLKKSEFKKEFFNKKYSELSVEKFISL